jgi:hypothetical protein
VRSVQIVDQSDSSTTRAEHVIGVDESGNVTGGGCFALAAVRCPREDGERLAELLIENDLDPWRAKSQTVVGRSSTAVRDQRVEDFIEAMESEPISWHAAAGYSGFNIHCKAAAVCVLAKKTITADSHFSGDAIIIPDGSSSMYGNKQKHLRTQANQIFDGAFQSTFGGIYVTGLAKADLTYPEATAADFLAGYVRQQIESGVQIESLPTQVHRFDGNWREPIVTPKPYYRIQGLGGDFGGVQQNRAVAWIKGRHPDGDSYDSSTQWQNAVQILESEPVQQYLLANFTP